MRYTQNLKKILMVLTNQLIYLVNIKTMRIFFFKLCVLLKKYEFYSISFGLLKLKVFLYSRISRLWINVALSARVQCGGGWVVFGAKPWLCEDQSSFTLGSKNFWSLIWIFMIFVRDFNGKDFKKQDFPGLEFVGLYCTRLCRPRLCWMRLPYVRHYIPALDLNLYVRSSSQLKKSFVIIDGMRGKEKALCERNSEVYPVKSTL